jgi:phosphoribosyl 1,2-cyclic phosphodiesterase/CheY-like chemotaxis protein
MSQSPTKTALIIDDDTEQRECLAEILQQNGWRVLTASQGEEGINLAVTRIPDVVLCDLLMPRCNGFQVCRALRREESLRRTRIIITSGRQFASDLQAASEAGADEYLTKPIDSTQLLQVLSRLTTAAASAAPAPAPQPVAPPPPTRMRFWGVRGSIPTPGPTTIEYGGNTTCIEVRADGQIIILDAGSGMRMLGRQLIDEFGHQPLQLTLLLTHTHWDHIQGLPFFQPVYKPQNHLRIVGYEGARHGLAAILTGQMESPFFPIGLRAVPANVHIDEMKDMAFNLGAVRVQAGFANHPGICVGYRLFTSGGSIAFFPDNELYPPPRPSLSGRDQDDGSATEFAHNENQKLIEFIRGVDVLVMDTQYDRAEYQRHVGWGHGCLDDVVNLALQAEVKQLFLFHHDPDHDDAKVSEMTEYARKLVAERGGTLRVEAAKEGEIIELPASERPE